LVHYLPKVAQGMIFHYILIFWVKNANFLFLNRQFKKNFAICFQGKLEEKI
jgi:hypothetical protein